MKRLLTIKTIVSILLLSFATPRAFAFINIEEVRQSIDEGFAGKANLKVAGQSGNTNKFSVGASDLNVWRGERDEFLLLGDYAFATTSKIKDTNNGRLHARQTFLVREIRSYELFSQFEFDEFKRLNARTLVGANLRTRLFSSTERKLFLGTGAMFESEDYSEEETRNLVRGNVYVSYNEVVNETVSGGLIAYYQPSLTSFSNYRARLQAGLDVKMTRNLSVSLDYSLIHDNEAPPDVVKTDSQYFAGFSLSY